MKRITAATILCLTVAPAPAPPAHDRVSSLTARGETPAGCRHPTPPRPTFFSRRQGGAAAPYTLAFGMLASLKLDDDTRATLPPSKHIDWYCGGRAGYLVSTR